MGEERSEASRLSQNPSASLDQRWRRLEPLRRRLALGAALGSLGGAALAVLDARWVVSGLSGGPTFGSAFLATAGVVAPIALLLGLVMGLLSWLVHPRCEPSLGLWLEALREIGTGRPADVAAFAPLAVLGLFAWTTLCAQLARLILAADITPLLAGSAIALTALLLGVVVAVLVFALTPWLRHTLAAARSGWERLVDPATTGLIALLLVASLIALGAALGNVSGEGGVLGIYGILKRQELDLRGPGLWLLLMVLTVMGPAQLPRLRPYQALLLALLPLGLTVHAAHLLNDSGDLARHVERSAVLAKPCLGILRRLTDRDRDGASAWFGGGDCNDRDPAIGPAAEDVPDNGIDEDCSGADLSVAGVTIDEPSPEPAPRSAERRADSLILITVDTLRYDLGYMGYEHPVSPNLDALAERSVVYERAYALASYTGKSVGPMLIGKYGSETHRNWGHFNKFDEKDTFLAQRLQAAGMKTVAVHGHRYFGKWGGLERGFDVLDLSAAPPESAGWANDTRVTSEALSDAAIARLDEAGEGERLFLWVHYLDPHADYKTHEGIPTFGKGARALYDGEVAFTDKHIGRLLDHVAKSSRAARTAVIVTSDHGEAFGEHKMWRHGVELWEPLVRVPLLVQVPGVAPKRIQTRRSLVDLAPTVLELLGVDPPSGEGDDFLSGRSLASDFEGEAKPRPIFVDMPGGPYNEERRAFILGDLKLVISGGGKKELYDLAADPGETKNLWSEKQEAIEAPYALFKKRLREIEVTGDRK